MIVAGIGCRKGATAEQIIAAVQRTVEHHGLALADVGLLATGEIKRHEAGISEAATMLGVPLLILDNGRLRAAAPGCLTSSAASMETAGVPSLSEAAAIAGAASGGRLLGPRLAGNSVTCALGITAWSQVATTSPSP
ncbi:MAG: cobalamin biosynthesis protein [Rhizobiaceae bacterium]